MQKREGRASGGTVEGPLGWQPGCSEDQERRLRRVLCPRGLCWWVPRKFSARKEARTQVKREPEAGGGCAVEEKYEAAVGEQGRAPRRGTEICLPGGTNGPGG